MSRQKCVLGVKPSSHGFAYQALSFSYAGVKVKTNAWPQSGEQEDDRSHIHVYMYLCKKGNNL